MLVNTLGMWCVIDNVLIRLHLLDLCVQLIKNSFFSHYMQAAVLR